MTHNVSIFMLSGFLIFCRIGGCLMVLPGFSSARVPIKIRLAIAVSVTMALTPFLIEYVAPYADSEDAAYLVTIVFSESMTGITIGLMGRMFFMALQFTMTAVASFAGFGAMPGAAIDENDPLPGLASMVTLTAAALIFIMDLHWEVFSALIASYKTMPVYESFSVRMSLNMITDRVSDTFHVALRVAAPFFVYSVIANLAIGLINKMTPQIPVYFISLPFILAGGLLLFYFAAPSMIVEFISQFGHWLRVG